MQARARFIQEAQAAAALDHPNICAVYEIAEAEGATYIAMPCVKGRSLKDKLAAGPLPLDEALDIAGQVAEGLKEAHERGIVHRDIKPANIMLTEKGQAKIMDFGLAKLAGAADVTKTLTVMGTPAYMAPEQAKGEAVDQRTDIWQFGATLYEMLTGEMPFGRRSDQALLYSIVHETPEPPTRLRPDIPAPLERVVLKALEKDKLFRYQTMAEILADLKAVRTSGLNAAQPEKSIVVLPFENISADPEQDYFCDGMTEELIADLSSVRALRVISRSSAMTFKGTKKKVREIASDVSVRYVLEGSVRKAGNALRISAQLIDAASDAHLWAEKYAGTLDDVFDIQEKVSRSIVKALKLVLTPEEAERLGARPIDNVAAYECYLKANAEVEKMTAEAIKRAIEYLRRALDVMGDNAVLYAGLAWACFQLVNVGAEHDEFLAQAKEYAHQALALDPEYAKAHAMLGFIAFFCDPWAAKLHFQKALSISPDDAFVLRGWVIYCIQGSGDIAGASRLLEKLIQVDPLDFLANFLQGLVHFYDGEYQLAHSRWRATYGDHPDNPLVLFYQAATLGCLDRWDEAFSLIDRSAVATPDNAFTKLSLMLKYAKMKDEDKTLREMTPDFQKTCRRDATFSHHLADIFSILGSRKDALDWLENAVDRGFINYPLLAEKDLFLANIRGEERFQKLMERVKKESAEFKI